MKRKDFLRNITIIPILSVLSSCEKVIFNQGPVNTDTYNTPTGSYISGSEITGSNLTGSM